ncbi:MAG: NUDIX hydrolase [Actinomycetia bacterium]|nr:NUDIX hydrolase [Actinomycetes bacterium]MCP4963088.1 NUDIX hydrolase [Actinomycetes bacterium]
MSSESTTPAGTGFEQVDETVRYQGRMVRMSTLHFRGPDGEEFERDFVHHPGAVAVLPITDDGSYVLVRQYRTPLGRETLELPAGVRDKHGEDAAAAAARELAEETGYVAATLVPMVSVHTAPGFTNEEVSIFVGTGLRQEAPEADGIEEQHMSVVELSPAEFDEVVASGEMTDAKTILAVYQYRCEGFLGA